MSGCWSVCTIDFHLRQHYFAYSTLVKRIKYNGWAEMNRQDFQVADLFWEIDPRRGVGWVLIVKGVSVICNIDRDKFGLRNMKNQILNFRMLEPKNHIFTQSKNQSFAFDIWKEDALPKIRVAHGRPWYRSQLTIFNIPCAPLPPLTMLRHSHAPQPACMQLIHPI